MCLALQGSGGASTALLLFGGWVDQQLLQASGWLLKLLLDVEYQPAPDHLVSEVSNAEPSQEGSPLDQTVGIFSDQQGFPVSRWHGHQHSTAPLYIVVKGQKSLEY